MEVDHGITELTVGDSDRMPAVGLGTWKIAGEQAAGVIREAVQLGWRHIDCAADYGNEAEVGAGLGRALTGGVCRREELWVTSKLWNTYHHPDHVRPACERSLRDLGLDTLDLYLMHFPIALEFVRFESRYPPGWIHDPAAEAPKMRPVPIPLADTWGAMENLVDAGLVRRIGVSNFGTSLLRDLLSGARIRPSVLQVELHPFLTQENLIRFCRQESIAVTGFSPLGSLSYVSGPASAPRESVLETTEIRAAAARHRRTPAQIALRWGVQRDTAVIPKTSNRQRLVENLDLFDFRLSEDEMEAISGLNRDRRYNDPGEFCQRDFGTFFPIYD